MARSPESGNRNILDLEIVRGLVEFGKSMEDPRQSTVDAAKQELLHEVTRSRFKRQRENIREYPDKSA
jgi:hypothetical protein